MIKLIFTLLGLLTSMGTKAQNIKFQHGTVILTIVTNDSIIMVADTRQNVNKNRFYVVSKINDVNNTFYAISGITTLRNLDNEEILLNISDTIKDIIKDTKLFVGISEKIRLRLYNSINTIHTIKPRLNLHEIFSDSLFIKVSIVKFSNSTPKYIFGVYKVFGNNFTDATIKFIEDKKTTSSPFLNRNGTTANIDLFLGNNKHFLDKFSVKKLVYLVTKEAEKNNVEVSCPIQNVTLKPSIKSKIKTISCGDLPQYLQNLN